MLTTEDLQNLMNSAAQEAEQSPNNNPNPRVGCVIFDETGKIIAKGHHKGAGSPHAETTALENLKIANYPKESYSKLSLMVTLEPCNHTGQTGPCVQEIIKSNIKNVFYSVSDPGITSSGGSKTLRNNGIEVTQIINPRAYHVTAPWFIPTKYNRPHLTLKWASTLDGKSAALDETSRWISSEISRKKVHLQRSSFQSIMVGTGTILIDDPSLTARKNDNELYQNQPIPVVIGERIIPDTAKIKKHPKKVIQLSGKNLLKDLKTLHSEGIQNIYVEGGPTLASSLIKANLIDAFYVFIAPKLLGSGKNALGDLGITTIAGALDLEFVSSETSGNDLFVKAIRRI